MNTKINKFQQKIRINKQKSQRKEKVRYTQI